MSLTAEQKQIIEISIERVAEVAGDPTDRVYARLFAEEPDMEPLFILDRDSSAKGHMLAEALDCVFDLLGPRTYARTLIQSELTNHSGFGVPPAVFATFFRTMKETFSEIMGTAWSAETDAAWEALLDEIDVFIEDQAKKYGMEVG
ncbi:globin [Parvibaculum sp.]|jgi:hemoglobin-like flavoprotein|uniref:globin n=1 Tax=Parvibaculum sp. TaxID=2024848 RepID=UPI000C659959|nr:globin [Parvibaculum sp.]MAM94171.1 globin [Parvibaculum sp.]HCX68544.1 globin [Rhodobiaceae bacterium]|tara:strand:- start:27798 stop:28235 length:438 start_codon:yes stop_codon:yes gene_type:complete